MIPRRHLLRSLCFLPALPLTSCVGPDGQAGDATVFRGPSIGGRNHDSYFLPKFPIGHRDSFTFEVDDPTAPTFPWKIYFHTRQSRSYFPSTPFDRSRIEVSVLDADSNQTVASRMLEPRHGWRMLDEDLFEYPIFTPREAAVMRPLNRYRVKVQVSQPSRREWDEAQIILIRR